MNNNPIIINKIPSTLFQQLLSATSTVERQVILKKYNELSLSTPTTLTEITQSKYLKWMDDFIESMNSENLNKIETLLKTFKDNSNDDDNNNNNNTTLMNAENIPKYLIETKLLSEENKDKFYSLLVSSFERRQHQIESLYIEVENQLNLWLSLCKENETLSFLLKTASKNSINKLIQLIQDKITSSNNNNNNNNNNDDDVLNEIKEEEELQQQDTDIIIYDLIKNHGEKYQFLIYHINILTSICNMYVQIQNYDKSIVLKINDILQIYQDKLIENRMLHMNNLVIQSILSEEWSHFKDPRDKFKRYSNGLAMYIVHMSTLCNELNDLKVYSNIFIQIFEATFHKLTLLYVHLVNVVNRARVVQYRVDILSLISIGLHFLYSDYGCSITNNINKMLNKLMITLTLFVGPVEPIIQYLKSKPNSNDTNVTDDNNDISFLQQNDFNNIFDIENISMDQRFQNRRNSNPIQLVQTIFSKGKKIKLENIMETIDLNHSLWSKTLIAAMEHTSDNYINLSKADSILIVSRRHELQDIEYPPMTKDDEIVKKKLEMYFKSIGNNQTI